MSNRIEKKLRCPNDGRAIGQIEIRDMQRWLVLPPSRDGHLRNLEAGLREALESFQERKDSYIEDFGLEWYQRVTKRIENDLLNLNKVHPARENPIPSDLDIGMHHLGKDVMPVHAPCPKCHTPWALRATLIDGQFNGVLISKE